MKQRPTPILVAHELADSAPAAGLSTSEEIRELWASQGAGANSVDEALDHIEAMQARHAHNFSKAMQRAMDGLWAAYKVEQVAFKDELLGICGFDGKPQRHKSSLSEEGQLPSAHSHAFSASSMGDRVRNNSGRRLARATSPWRDAAPNKRGSSPAFVVGSTPQTGVLGRSAAHVVEAPTAGMVHQVMDVHVIDKTSPREVSPKEIFTPREIISPPSQREVVKFATDTSGGYNGMQSGSVNFLPFEMVTQSQNHSYMTSFTPASQAPGYRTSMQHVSTVILQRHLREVQYGQLGSRGTADGLDFREATPSRRKSLGSIVGLDKDKKIDDVRAYLRRQRCKAFLQDRKDAKHTLVATMLEMLLRPVGDREHVDTPLLDLVMSIIVVVNTITIGVSTDLSRTWHGWFAFDIVFASCYLLEFTLKMKWVGLRRYFRGKDAMINTFDFALLCLAWMEVVMVSAFGGVSGANLLQIIRIVRIIKVLRICRLGMFADMLMMINGAIGSFKTLLYSIFLIALPLYVVSLFFHEVLREHAEEGLGAEEFETLALTVFNIFRCIIANECTNQDGKPIFSRIVTNYGWHYGLIYCFTVTFMTFGLFNVIVAIYVENIVSAAKLTARRTKRKRLLDRSFFEEKCLQLLRFVSEEAKSKKQADKEQLESSGDSTDFLEEDVIITPEFLARLLGNEDFARLLRELDIADEDMIDLFETLDVNANGEVDTKELIVGLARLRGEFRRSDIIGVSLLCRSMQEFLLDMDYRLQAMQAERFTAPSQNPACETARAEPSALFKEVCLASARTEDVTHIRI
mmetsp:Transcript_1417/g.3853  ORF Transcript_1417/g.3853 Transcript_1417/m.3853 type:complete len:802 (-) Transcript_1417:17-2422(-)